MRNLILVIVAVIAAFVNANAQSSSGFSYYKNITIDHNRVSGSSSHSNFPVLVSVTDNALRTTGNGGRLQNNNGWDILLTNSTGTTDLNFQIESYTATNGNLVAWVRVPSLSHNTNTVIRIYYGKTGVASNPSSNSTWTSDYRAIYHFNNSINDATSNSNNGTNTGSTHVSSAKIGQGRGFNGSSHFITVPNSSSLNISGNTITVSAWVNVVTANQDGPFAVKGIDMNQEQYMLGVNESSPKEYNMRVSTNSDHFRYNRTSISFNNWVHVAMVYDAGLGSNPRMRMYVNGSESAAQNANGAIRATNGSLMIGKRPGSDNRYLHGNLDELRISNVAKTADWIATEYNNQNSPATFYTIGSEQTLLLGSVTVNQNVSCFGGSNGSITASATGGTAPYTYNWGGGISTAARSGLSAGSYTVTITATGGATATATATVTQPAAILAGSVTVNQQVSCRNGSNGSITASATGGTAPYTYNWGGGITTAARTGLAANTYTVTITDSRSCTTTANNTITQPAAVLVGSVTVNQQVSCRNGSNGSITASATGGTAPYTYNWGGGITTAARTGLAANTYTVTITDSRSCTTTANNTITQPAALATSAVVSQHVTCDGCSNGSVASNPVGGTAPYTYNWGGGITTASRAGLEVGTYTVTVTDNIGCTATSSVIVNQTSFLQSYEFRKAVTVDASKVCGNNDLYSFPILVNVSDNDLRTLANGGKVYNTNGWDIVFTDSDGSTILNHEVENYTASSGAYRAWVQVPTLTYATNKVIYMYFGKAGSLTNPSTKNTWNADYAGVWHLQGDLSDASNNTNNGTNYSTTSTTGKIGDARSFSGANQYVDCGQNNSLKVTNGTTVSAWIYRNGNEGHIINMGGGWGDHGYSLFWLGNDIRIELQRNGQKAMCDNAAPSQNAWHHVAFTWSNSDNTIRTYINGTQAGATANFNAPIGSPIQNLQIGKNANQSGYLFGGYIDEARVLNAARSAGWICTEYNNQDSPSTFYSVGNLESLTPAGTIIWRGTTNQNWSIGSNWSTGSVPTETDSVYVPAGTPNSLQLNGSGNYNVNHIYFDSLATLSASSNGTLNIKGNLHVNSCGFNVNNGHIKFNGNVAQYIYSNCKTSYHRLYIENTSSSGVYLVGASVQVNHELYLRDGYLYTASDTVIVARNSANNAIKEYNEDDSHVVGYLTRYLNKNNNTYAFPVGKGSNTSSYLISIKNNDMEGISQLTVIFKDLDEDPQVISSILASMNVTEDGIAYNRLCDEGMWTIEPNIQPTNGSYDIIADLKNFTSINSTDFGILKKPRGSEASNWGLGNGQRNNNIVGDVSQGLSNVIKKSSAKRNGLTSFSDFGVGNNDGGIGLPIELISFTGAMNVKTKAVDLLWSTATEINNELFVVQRSLDGVIFEEIGRVAGAGNSSATLNYTFADTQPEKGIVYYRLKQIDFDGKYAYSDLISITNVEVTTSVTDIEVKVYPNPTDGIIKIFAPTDEPEIHILIIDVNGSVIKSVTAYNESEDFFITMNLKDYLRPGYYFVKVSGKSFASFKKIQVF